MLAQLGSQPYWVSMTDTVPGWQTEFRAKLRPPGMFAWLGAGRIGSWFWELLISNVEDDKLMGLRGLSEGLESHSIITVFCGQTVGAVIPGIGV